MLHDYSEMIFEETVDIPSLNIMSETLGIASTVQSETKEPAPKMAAEETKSRGPQENEPREIRKSLKPQAFCVLEVPAFKDEKSLVSYRPIVCRVLKLKVEVIKADDDSGGSYGRKSD